MCLFLNKENEEKRGTIIKKSEKTFVTNTI